MSVNRSTPNSSDINERSHVTGASRFRPVADAGARKRNSESPMEAVRILPNNNIGETPNFVYMNGKHPTPGRPRKRPLDNTEVNVVNQIQPKEKQSCVVQSIIPKPCSFDWDSYLKETNSSPAPVSYFTHVPLDIRNDCLSVRSCTHTPLSSSFRPNQCMEGIDPHHESLFCALKVAEVVGRRLRLRFIGYPEKYDFWTTVDSPFLFPVGWCAQNKRHLQPPKSALDRGQMQFDWNTFMLKENLTPVPRHLFRVPWYCPVNDSPTHMFRVGHKLEAVDKRNPGIACVATVKDSIGDYILIHFDGWNSSFDQWAHITSELLHPVGYCEDQELVLSIPAEWNSRPTGFTWKQYLKETNSKAVPKEAFGRVSKQTTPYPQLEVGQRLEAVDRRCPQLIRVATIVSTSPSGFITINYDGWPDKYNVRLESSSLDLFPAGYCQTTGHPLQPPLRYDADVDVNGASVDAQSTSSTSSISGSTVCPTPGCKGYGHVKGPRYATHQRLSGCPYSDLNLGRDLIRPHERLSASEITSTIPDSTIPKLEQAVDDNGTLDSLPGLSPDSSVKTDTVPSVSKDHVSNCVSAPQSPSSAQSACVPTSLVSIHTNGNTVIPGISSPPPPVHNSTTPSSYDVASLTTDQQRVNSSPSTAMPLDLSVIGKSRMKETSAAPAAAASSRGTKTIRKLEDVPIGVNTNGPVSSVSGMPNHPVNPQALDTSSTNHTPDVREPHVSASAPFIDIPTQSGSKRPSAAASYPKAESKPRLTSIANAANEYARQQQMFGIAGLPVKRKRGRPRKYGSLTMTHTPATSRTTAAAHCTSPTGTGRNSMPHIPMYNTTAPVTTNKSVNMQQASTATTMMPALSIYTPLTVGPSGQGLYSTGLLVPGSNAPLMHNTDMSQNTGSSAATWSHVDSSGSTGTCMVATSASGPHSDVTEPAVSRSPGNLDNGGLTSVNTDPSSLRGHSSSELPKSSPFVPPTSQRHGDPHSLSEWPHDHELANAKSTFGCLSGHDYFDPTRHAMYRPSPASNPLGLVEMTGSRVGKDVDLMGRIVPQAGAALRASKAAGLTGPHSWNTAMVSNFVCTIPGCKQFASKFIENEIDGAALLCLEQHDLMQVLGMKLGPAVKVAGAIQTLRRSLMSTPLSDLGAEYANAVAAAKFCFNEETTATATVPPSASGDSVQGQNVISSTRDSTTSE